MIDIAASLAAVKDGIAASCDKAGRRTEEVRLVAVTKRVDPERIQRAVDLGVRDFGENYMQEARKKIEAMDGSLTWHMIGHVQGNKIKQVASLFDYVHSVDRLEVLEGLERCGKKLSVLFELNLSAEPQKHGTTPDGLRAMLEKAPSLKAVTPVGLMTMAPFTDEPEEARPVFRRLRKLLEEVNREFDLPMRELSMGMSSDFRVAVEEGATMVRVGTALFGERQ